MTFPLTGYGFRVADVRVRQASASARVRSPFTGASQALSFGGAWWEMDVTLAPARPGAAFDAESAWLTRLQGVAGSFTFKLPFYRARAAITTSPTLVGAAVARQRSITVQMATGEAMAAGDHVSIAGHLQIVAEIAAPDGSDRQAVTLWPGLRKAAADGATVEALAPVGTWALGDPVTAYAISQQHVATRALTLVEAGF